MESEPAVIDWKDLLLIILLCCIISLLFWLILDWAAWEWSLDWLLQRGRRGSIASVVAALGGGWVGFRIAVALGFRPTQAAQQT